MVIVRTTKLKRRNIMYGQEQMKATTAIAPSNLGGNCYAPERDTPERDTPEVMRAMNDLRCVVERYDNLVVLS